MALVFWLSNNVEAIYLVYQKKRTCLINGVNPIAQRKKLNGCH